MNNTLKSFEKFLAIHIRWVDETTIKASLTYYENGNWHKLDNESKWIELRDQLQEKEPALKINVLDKEKEMFVDFVNIDTWEHMRLYDMAKPSEPKSDSK